METEYGYVPTYEIATLGPSGTCSDQVAQRYLRASNLDQSSIVLTSTFEAAAELVKQGAAKRLLVPSAYRNHADIVFDNAADITAIDAFPSPTPEFFFLTKPGRLLSEALRVASHASPRRLLDGVRGLKKGRFTVVDASSNVGAAELLERGEVDGCLTVRSSRTEGMLRAGKAVLIAHLGVIMMTWVVMVRTSQAASMTRNMSMPIL